MSLKPINNGETGLKVRESINKALKSIPTEHDKLIAYQKDDRVLYFGKVLHANDDIPANTPVTIGTTGATWAEVITSSPLTWLKERGYTKDSLVTIGTKIYQANSDIPPNMDFHVDPQGASGTWKHVAGDMSGETAPVKHLLADTTLDESFNGAVIQCTGDNVTFTLNSGVFPRGGWFELNNVVGGMQYLLFKGFTKVAAEGSERTGDVKLSCVPGEVLTVRISAVSNDRVEVIDHRRQQVVGMFDKQVNYTKGQLIEYGRKWFKAREDIALGNEFNATQWALSSPFASQMDMLLAAGSYVPGDTPLHYEPSLPNVNYPTPTFNPGGKLLGDDLNSDSSVIILPLYASSKQRNFVSFDIRQQGSYPEGFMSQIVIGQLWNDSADGSLAINIDTASAIGVLSQKNDQLEPPTSGWNAVLRHERLDASSNRLTVYYDVADPVSTPDMLSIQPVKLHDPNTPGSKGYPGINIENMSWGATDPKHSWVWRQLYTGDSPDFEHGDPGTLGVQYAADLNFGYLRFRLKLKGSRANFPIATLPADYRPLMTTYAALFDRQGNENGSIYITTDGLIYANNVVTFDVIGMLPLMYDITT